MTVGRTDGRTDLNKFSPAPPLEAQTVDFSNKENLKGIEEYGAAWASGNMETLLPLLAADFTLTLGGPDFALTVEEPSAIAREDVPAFYETSRKKVVSSPTGKPPQN